MAVLVQEVLSKAKNLVVDSERLAVIKEEVSIFSCRITIFGADPFSFRTRRAGKTFSLDNPISSLTTMDVT